MSNERQNASSPEATSVAPGGDWPVVRTLTELRAPDWDAFVLAAPEGTFFHRSGWRDIFETVFRFETHFLYTERKGVITGVLPLVYQRSLLFGKSVLSAPFCVEGGPVSSDRESKDALDAAAISLMNSRGASYVEYRSRKASRPDWVVKKGLYATFSRTLSSSDQANLLSIPRKQRAVIRKTLESGLRSELDTRADRLFRVYSESVWRLGTPVFPKRYFEMLNRVFGSDCDIVVIVDDGVPLSAAMNFYYKGTVFPYYGGGTASARRNGANDFLYWEVMRRAALRGCGRFDFGRSKVNTGAFAFKKNWGFEPEWLEYEYWLKEGVSTPQNNPSNPKYAVFVGLWRRLPLPIANFLGPFVNRNLN